MDSQVIDPSQREPPMESHSHQLNHNLNREKQVNNLLNNATKIPIEIEINNNDANVNVICSPGFYEIVVRPSLLSQATYLQ